LRTTKTSIVGSTDFPMKVKLENRATKCESQDED